MTKLSLIYSLLFFLIAIVNIYAIELTPENFDEVTGGKTVFIKFYDPQCPHCQKMASAWDQLEEHFRASKNKAIASVDCTSEEGYKICEEHGLQDFPTLKWGDATSHLEDYEGPRDFESLRKFSDRHLKPLCGPNHIQLCDKATRREIRRLKKLTLKELDREIAAKAEEYNKLEREFKKFVDDLEAQFEKAQKKKDEDVKKIKEDSGLTLMKAVERDMNERSFKATPS